jgi:predicted alpha-1,2-mannosidase
MKNFRFPLMVLVLTLSGLRLVAQDYTQFVNPFIGTAGHAHTFPGPTRPFGLVQLSPDMRLFDWDWCSGYNQADTVILGFSHTHLSGTGVGDLGDVLICPYLGDITFKQGTYNNPDGGYAFRFQRQTENAEVGYYAVENADDGIKIELASAHRAALHRYTFPKSQNANVVVDLGSTIYDPDRKNILESQVEIIDNYTIQGYKIVKGWAPLRRVYFYLKFSKPFYKFACNDGEQKENVSFLRHSNQGVVANLTFITSANEQILAKVGISFVSQANAIENSKEILYWDFEHLVEESKAEWNKYLSRISIEGTTDQKNIFYTGLYHTMIHPNNIADTNGDFVGPDYNIHRSETGSYYSTFSLWDTYRAVHPLYTLVVPEKVGHMAHSMLEHFRWNGYLPIWTLAGTENHCMIGNHSIPVIADAILKGISGFDYKKAYEAIKFTSTKDHPNSNWNKHNYDSLGYMPAGADWQGAARTLDFCFDDWCAAKVAKKMNFTDDYTYFINRSEFYKNQFNPKVGLTWPRLKDGTFKPNHDPKFISYDSDFTEGNGWQYTFLVQHDPMGLIGLYPSTEKFLEKFDSMFVASNVPLSNVGDVEVGRYGQYIHSNEPSHHIIYLYNYAGQPYRTQKLISEVLKTEYRNAPDGLAGNEDCGQMSAWYVFNAMGLYPFNPASGNYDFGSPILQKAVIHLPEGKTFTISAPKVSDKNCYIQSIKFNGKPYKKLYITHSDILRGGELHFEMGDKPQKNKTNYETSNQEK